MPRSGKSPFVGLILHHIQTASINAGANNGKGAIYNLRSAAVLVGATVKIPPTPFNPKYSKGSNNTLLDAYYEQLPAVGSAVKAYISRYGEDDFEVVAT